MSARLVLVRHAQASFDADDYDRLTPLGERQARALADWWRDAEAAPRSCWTGGLRRQAQTAAPLLAACPGVPLLECVALREFDHREIFYRQRPDLLPPAALADWKAQPDYARRFDATWRAALGRWMDPRHAADYTEAWPAFQARCLSGIRQLLGRLAPGETALAFTSSGPLAVVLAACAGPDQGHDFADIQGRLFNTGLTELRADAEGYGRGRLDRVNALPHLDSGLHTLR
ncbi:MAG: histidine phosphatase family protein [Pseudomonadota bacterium]|nr:histidine phosphatase family protein [Pseudomonadota bacterium]